ncbi:MAG: hypothetical protein ABSG04_02330 [Verrucomicrobiota bacterium]|jgi:hypothetical protein
MEVNTNFSAGGVGGILPQKPAAPAAKTAAAPDAFAGSNALARAVENLPASRPEALALARELVADPSYPSPAILRQVSSLLARNLIAALD